MEKAQSNGYVQVLFDKMEACRQAGKIISFRLEEITKNGFKVKVGGLFAFVPFKIMPWQYSDKSAWEVVFPHMQGRHFSCKIDHIETIEGRRRLFLDPSVHRLQPPAFEEGQEYEGLVLKRTDYGVFLDLGFHHRWRSGSHVALLHISHLKNRGLVLQTIRPGDRLTATWFGINPEGRIQLEVPFNLSLPCPGLDLSLVEQVLSVQVKKDEESGKNSYIVGDGFIGRMPVTKHQYEGGPAMKKAIREALQQLPDGCIIYCEVTAISYRRGGGLLLRWVASDWRT